MATKKPMGATSRGEYKKSNKDYSVRVYDYVLTPTGHTAKGVNKNISSVDHPATPGKKQEASALFLPELDITAHTLAYKETKKLKLSDTQKDIEYEKAYKKYKSALSNE